MIAARTLIEALHCPRGCELDGYAEAWADRLAPRAYKPALKARYGDDWRAAEYHTENLVRPQWEAACTKSNLFNKWS